MRHRSQSLLRLSCAVDITVQVGCSVIRYCGEMISEINTLLLYLVFMLKIAKLLESYHKLKALYIKIALSLWITILIFVLQGVRPIAVYEISWYYG